ncbi:glycosyltransferase family 4 protein [Desulfogranum mediterraneum]|uniref:glycosyltransferase family 4 protein n=1 Tax=Desulfogranum mediterraneum TaxID=160661 RepID=UPI000425B216|nr:glycosyltransferase family 4 protein [Desulfogranum mediterraneum]
MKITFILPYAGLAGGIRVVAIYAELLKKRGHEVTVVSVPRRPLTIKDKIKTLLREKRWPSQSPEPSHFDKVDVQHTVLEKLRPITEYDLPDADVVIATWWETAEWVNALPPSKGTKFYFVQHHETHAGLPVERVKATYALPLRKITISKWLIDIMANEYGDSNVALVPNSVDHHFFNAPERGRQQQPTVGYLYSTTHYKGCDIIHRALAKVQETIPGLRVLTFGSCQLSEALPLPEKATFYHQPSQEKIREIYSSCDFWLFGSRVEGFGLPLLEAMACRTPVIGTNAGAAPELFTSGGGILLKDWTPETMAETIIQAIGLSEQSWKRISEKARTTSSGYSWDDAAALFESALSALQPKNSVKSS